MLQRLFFCLCMTAGIGMAVADDSSQYHQGSTSSATRETVLPPPHSSVDGYAFQEGAAFSSDENFLDVFGFYAPTDGSFRYHDDLGAGLGIGHFFTRYLGLEIEGYWWDGDATDEVISSFSGSVIFRCPMTTLPLAPYLLAGGGGHFSSIDQASIHGGGGLEYRLNPHTGVFSDARYVATEDTNDFGLIRFGMRYAF